MLQQILSKLEPSTVTEAGLTLHGLKLEPCDDGLVLSLLPRGEPYEPGVLHLDLNAMREVAKFFNVAADVIEGAQ